MTPLFRFLVIVGLLSMPLNGYARDKVEPGEYVTEGGWGNLKIAKDKKGGLAFELLAMGANGHTCELSGKIENGRAVLPGGTPDKPCLVSFDATDQGIGVSDNDGVCRYYCGARAGFAELYLKPQPGCEAGSVLKASKEFELLYDRKAYRQARAKLEPVLKNCARVIHWSELGDLRNDLAQALYKQGDYAGCRSTLQPLAEEARLSNEKLRELYPPADAEIKIQIAEMTRTNLKRCQAGQDKALRGLRARLQAAALAREKSAPAGAAASLAGP